MCSGGIRCVFRFFESYLWGIKINKKAMANICHSLFIALEPLNECPTIVKSRFGGKENSTTFVV